MSLDLKSLIDFVDAEFRYRFRSVIDLMSLPIPRRVDEYTCWPGLVVKNTDAQSGKLELSFRTNPSKLRTGDHIHVNRLDVEPKDVISGPEGVIEELDEGKGFCRVRPGFQQATRFKRLFRIDERVVLDQTMPAAHLAREMPTLALRILGGEMGDSPRISRIKAILAPGGAARPTPEADQALADDELILRLTKAQREAVHRAVTEDFVCVQGPPGTGKTFTLGVIIRELVRRGLKVGVCAFTHQGIDNLLAECLKHPLIPEVCKIGGREGSGMALDHERFRRVDRVGAFFKAKNTPSVTGLTHHAAFYPISHALQHGSQGLEASLPHRFDVLVFDEAGQLTLPGAIMAMLQCDRMVVAGDHAQLPPVVNSMRAGTGPARSFFQHLVEVAGHEPVLLNETFRLNASLVKFPSEMFYAKRLVASATAMTRTLRIDLSACQEAANILDPAQASTLALVRHQGRGQESPEEAALAAMLVAAAVAGGVPSEEIAVIAPHRRQNTKIRQMLAEFGVARGTVMVDTVERIQGQERDLIIMSMTTSDADALAAGAEFLFLPNRFNVAITRARRKLVVIASPHFFRALPGHGALASQASSLLAKMNVLKQWYFCHRTTAVEATDVAARALTTLTRPEASQTLVQQPRPDDIHDHLANEKN